MPPYQWTLIEPERHEKGNKEGATRPIKDTKDVSLHSGNKEVHNYINLPIGTLRQEGHASNADKWVTLPETAQGRKSRRRLTLSTTIMASQSTSHLPPYRETVWPQ